jgi:alcohol dehydrogenase
VVIAPFRVSPLPEIVFGAGSSRALPDRIAAFGTRFLLVRGVRSLRASAAWPSLEDGFGRLGLRWDEVEVVDEPSPDLVDAAVASHRDGGFEVVVGLGGGSALDAAKAIAGLLRTGTSAMDHLEDVGRGIPYEGPAVPFLAVPTTAGTGTEATKNAVLSRRGPRGFKKSFRDDRLMARCVVVDPDFLASCPPELIAADGMDAVTQLLESYTSLRASRLTDALCESGLAAARDGLLPWHEGTGDPASARSSMAYAALLSGIALAQAGLGAVHGLAQPLGSLFPVPHGVVCGTLVASATRTNVAALRARAPGSPALTRYARAWEILAGMDGRGAAPAGGAEALADLLENWAWRLRLPGLSRFGVLPGHLPEIVAGSRGSSMKSNPVVLTDDEIAAIVRARL